MRCGRELAEKLVDRFEPFWPSFGPGLRERRIAVLERKSTPIPEDLIESVAKVIEGNENAT